MHNTARKIQCLVTKFSQSLCVLGACLQAVLFETATPAAQGGVPASLLLLQINIRHFSNMQLYNLWSQARSHTYWRSWVQKIAMVSFIFINTKIF
jgi:hypothetical protein